jgi:hypothetical protein
LTSLRTTAEFFDTVVRENHRAHQSGDASLVTVFNLAISLWALREWAFQTNKPDIESQLGVSASDPRDLDQPLRKQCPEWGQIAEVANALKHVNLRKPEPGYAKSSQDLVRDQRGYGLGAYGVGRFGGLQFDITTDSGTIDFDDCVENAFRYWEEVVRSFNKAPQDGPTAHSTGSSSKL